MESRYIIGIDLGTTNCAVACVDPGQGSGAPVVDIPVPQLQRPGEVIPRPLLPSCLYVPGEHELPAGSTALPWNASPRLIAGEFARWQGARVPGRLVSSAKSWLCHSGVDRSAPILPYGAPPDVAKISPVDSSSLLLQHMAAAWNHAHPAAPIASQEVVITVPASFDEAARALTVEAARRAGLEKITLVEEPQAAFYDFTSRHRHHLADALKETRLVLVVDVGGGTTDFTLIQVHASSQGPMMRRIAVGDHLMLGGDNMDAAIARKIEERWTAQGRKLTPTQWTQLVQAARNAKESLLTDGGPERFGVSVVSEGSRLLGGTLSAEVTRQEVEEWILNGFLPICPAQEAPRRSVRGALQELGLPYAQDPAITRHLAAFLRLHARAGFDALAMEPGRNHLPRPDAILLNGGVFNSTQMTWRLIEATSAWWPDFPVIPLLKHDSLELAVARGAAYYGLARRGLGRKIGGGTARAFYIGLDTREEQNRAVCVIPRGHEEGEPVDLLNRPFTLTVGRPVQFPLFSTSSDRLDRPGDVIEISEELVPLPPIHTLFEGGAPKSTTVPVHLRATLTEIGTLELWCVSNQSEDRWRLEFEVRGASASPTAVITESMPAHFDEARKLVTTIFGGKALPTGPREAKQLARSLEKILGPRDQWRASLLREMWSILFAGAAKRRRSAEHERAYLQLLGYSLRPGFGYPLDDWRCSQTFKLFGESVSFHKELPIWNEFWILWRRIAGGLDEASQNAIWNYLKPFLASRVPPGKDAIKGQRPKGIQPEGYDEMVRTAASLEHLAPENKIELGEWILKRLAIPETTGGPWVWALGRLGARVPIYGSIHKAIPAALAAEWTEKLLQGKPMDGTPFALAQLSRLAGDRTRDLDDPLRNRVVSALKSSNAPENWIRMVTEIVSLKEEEEAIALGDTLPIGLQLLS